MTKEEAIERIKYLLFIYKKDDEKGYRATGEVFNTDFEAIETVLNMLKEKDTEIEKKDKMIDLMAYSLADYVMYYEYDKCRSPLMIKDKSEELKEYYERKATNDG